MGLKRTVQRMLAATDPSRSNAEVWFTELGFQSSGSAADNTEQDRDIVKVFVMAIAQGVSTANWYEARDGQGGFGLLKSDGSERPAYPAIQNLIKSVGPQPNYLGWVQLNPNKDYGFVFQGPSSNSLVIWAVAGQQDSIRFSANTRILNPVTSTITPLSSGSTLTLSNDPVIVLDVPSDVVSQAQRNKNQPFLWGGDFTNVKTISSTMGNTNTDNGLHQFNPDQSSMPVIVYGGPARSCNKSSNQDFTVDPNYLSYNPASIQITTVTRRNEANDNAGFNIVYEGPDGWKNYGVWYGVPGNDKWYTNTVTIHDPQFISIWGFNFRLSSDSTTNSKYYLQSVSVTKV